MLCYTKELESWTSGRPNFVEFFFRLLVRLLVLFLISYRLTIIQSNKKRLNLGLFKYSLKVNSFLKSQAIFMQSETNLHLSCISPLFNIYLLVALEFDGKKVDIPDGEENGSNFRWKRNICLLYAIYQLYIILFCGSTFIYTAMQ
jgi:hypothetical protein